MASQAATLPDSVAVGFLAALEEVPAKEASFQDNPEGAPPKDASVGAAPKDAAEDAAPKDAAEGAARAAPEVNPEGAVEASSAGNASASGGADSCDGAALLLVLQQMPPSFPAMEKPVCERRADRKHL